jgi:hypothetical protein
MLTCIALTSVLVWTPQAFLSRDMGAVGPNLLSWTHEVQPWKGGGELWHCD